MSIIQSGRYHHKQKGPWGLLCYAFAIGFLVAAMYLPVLALQITFLATGLFMLLLGASLGYLTIEDQGGQLAIHFGPFPLFRKRIRYDDIAEVERGQTTFLDGWGIHWSPWGGWVWNVWGYDCVIMRLKSGKFRVGTDDAEGLAEFLKGRITEKG
jgi:hypothetical protein